MDTDGVNNLNDSQIKGKDHLDKSMELSGKKGQERFFSRQELTPKLQLFHSPRRLEVEVTDLTLGIMDMDLGVDDSREHDYDMSSGLDTLRDSSSSFLNTTLNLTLDDDEKDGGQKRGSENSSTDVSLSNTMLMLNTALVASPSFDFDSDEASFLNDTFEVDGSLHRRSRLSVIFEEDSLDLLIADDVMSDN